MLPPGVHSRPNPSAFWMAIISFCFIVFLLRYEGRTSWLKHVCDIGNLKYQHCNHCYAMDQDDNKDDEDNDDDDDDDSNDDDDDDDYYDDDRYDDDNYDDDNNDVEKDDDDDDDDNY